MMSSCGVHNFESNVESNFKSNQFEQNYREMLYQAYLTRDKKNFERLVNEESVAVDTLLNDGYTLLYKATERGDFSWVYFLMKLGAQPDLQMSDSSTGKVTSPMLYVTNLPEENFKREVLQALFGGELELVSHKLLIETLLITNKQSEAIDSEWLETLLEHDGRLDLDLKTFKKIFFKELPQASNYISVVTTLLESHISWHGKWREFIAEDFITGKFRQGQCGFYKQKGEVDFTSFLKSCSPKTHKKFQQIQASIERYLYLWNRLATYE